MDPRLIVALLVAAAVAGCVGQDTPQDAVEANGTDPAADTPEQRDTDDGDEPDSTDDPGSNAETNRTAEGNVSIAADLVWATERAVVRWDPNADNVTRVAVEDAAGSYDEITAIARGPDGEIYATTTTSSADPVESVHAGPPLANPLALTLLEDGRVLVADRGETAWPPASAPSPTGRVVEIGTDGTATVLTADPRFDDWMDIHATADGIYLATQTDQQMTSPTAPGGTGAIWQVDATTGSHELVSSSSLFQDPSGLVGDGDGGLYVSEWTGARLLQVDPSSGEATVVSPVNGSQNLWGTDTLPDGRVVVADADGIWIVDPDDGTHRRLVEDPEGEPRHVLVFEGS